jgi:hypothetical protein
MKIYLNYENIKKTRYKIFSSSWYGAIILAVYNAGEIYYLAPCWNFHACIGYNVVCITLYVNTYVVLGLFFYLLAIIRFYVVAVLRSTNVAGWGGDMCLAHLVTGRADNATIYGLPTRPTLRCLYCRDLGALHFCTHTAFPTRETWDQRVYTL